MKSFFLLLLAPLMTEAFLMAAPSATKHSRRWMSDTEDTAYQSVLSGLRWRDDRIGDGPTPAPGDVVVIDYRGSLTKTGKQFDASYDRGTPFSFELGEIS